MQCLAFSEPEHGSDLGSIETRADFLGDAVLVTGRKTWVAGASCADSALVLCRTPANEHICVCVPLQDNNVEIRPIRTLDGENALCELVFDGARAPRDSVIANGLQVAESTLNQTPWLDCEREFWELVDTARQNGRNTDPHVRQQLAWAYAQMRVIRVLATRDTSLARLVWSEYHRRLGEIGVEVMGADGLVRLDGEAYATKPWQRVFLTSRGDTIAGGTTEVQRTALAERLLGMPGEA